MPEELFTGKELKERKLKTIIYLREEVGLKFTQIAPQVRLSPSATRQNYYKAKQKEQVKCNK